jgi:leader peptidase (prepilin peptidase)/N-methyltransferase
MILLSALCALALAVIYLRRPEGQGLRTAIPFGPFLCLGAVLTLLWGEDLLEVIIGI